MSVDTDYFTVTHGYGRLEAIILTPNIGAGIRTCRKDCTMTVGESRDNEQSCKKQKQCKAVGERQEGVATDEQ